MLRSACLFFLLLLCIVARSQQNQLTLMLPTGHSGGIYNAVFSPDYKYILSSDRFEIARLWDAKTGYLLANLKGHNGRVYRLGYSPKGNMFYTAGADDSTIIIWNAATATPLFTFKGSSDVIQGGNFNLQQDKFIAASKDVRVWDLTTGALLQTYTQRQRKETDFFEMRTPKISNDGSLATVDIAENDGFFRYFWKMADGQPVATFKFNDTTQKFTLLNNSIDTSLLNPESNVWKHPPFYPATDRALDFSLNSNDLWITDSSKQKKILKITAHVNMTRLIYPPTDSTLITEAWNRPIAAVWNMPTMQMIKNISYPVVRPMRNSGEQNSNIVFNNNRSYAVQLSNHNFRVYNVAQQKELKQFSQPDFKEKLQHAFFSNGDSLLISIVYGVQQAAHLWHMKTGKLLRVFDFNPDEFVTYAAFSNDNQWLALYGNDTSIRIYETFIGQLVHSIRKNVAESKDVFGGDISPDKQFICFLDNNAVFQLYNITHNQLVYALDKQPGNYVTAARFSTDSKQIILGMSSGLNKVIDLQTKQTIYEFFQVDSLDYFTRVPGGYYQASPGAAKLIHYVTPDLKLVTFDQLDIRFNRPDKVQELIGNKNDQLIRSFRNAYYKRLKKLGIDTTQFSNNMNVPECDFARRENIDFQQKKPFLRLRIKASDMAYDLDRFNIWVNDVPVYGMKGASLRNHKKQELDTVVQISLSAGNNRIETSVINANGTESLKAPLFVEYTPATIRKPVIHFIGIGINRFANPAHNLSWSVKDIRDLAKKIKSKYPDVVIDTLFDKKVTKKNILAFKQKLAALQVDDKVIISYSGHGLLSKEFDYYLSTYNCNFSDPAKEALPYEQLEGMLDGIAARQKLLLIDACHSGELDKDELVRLEAAQPELNKNGVTARGSVKLAKDASLGMANSFELMQNLFVNVSKGTGATIISAAGGMQYALERGDLQNGVFTYSIIDAFNTHSTLTVSQLKKLVGDKVLQLTQGLQKPTSRNETNNYDWVLW